ncbi:MAG: single-stranded DNA-binding protein [Clostridia bacterium]|nr:single-stranded DNA-binding protein [Clostridia bacterium]MBQ9117994.1 single-stranded DNA-binding protein [Clostridia bacterium]
MNKVFLIGNLTRDPELSETPSGVAMCRFSIAVNRNYTSSDGERQTDFFNCTAWRGQAETIARYTKKGNKVAVTGSIQLRNYEDNQGVKRTAVDVIVQDVEFLTPKSDSSDFDGEEAPHAAAVPKKKPSLRPMDDDGDIPF